MRIENKADATVNDINIPIICEFADDMSGKIIVFEILKPSGKSIFVIATVAGDGMSAEYLTVANDLDESGTYYVFVYNQTDSYYLIETSNNIFTTRSLPTEMAR